MIAGRASAEVHGNRLLNLLIEITKSFCPEFGDLWKQTQIPELAIIKAKEKGTNLLSRDQLTVPGNGCA